ncbi:dynein assembly factor 5, axonemal isoform X1 [Nasonia vitripennis]|uniref:HEAT repeat-containing protein 2 n=1 Tax=Nasonia vitripennis TaxID=7425 RepID=A0A7M7LV92_NASVI|nr:dynein assembly factor 5, axonemal isoform X1 [Nasonia vitripennis]
MPQIIDLQYDKICTSLQAEDKFKRKKGLQEILKNVLNSLETKDEESSLVLWEIFHRPVIRILHDPVEACRDLALEILKKFLLHLPCSDKNIVYIIPIMAKRLGCQELVEQSEEVRLKCIILLRAIVQKYQENLISYFEDLITILTRTVTDKYPKVKKESCDCICEIARAMPSNFYTKSEVFVKPILTNISHQHYKIRMATVKSIGEVLLFGDSKLMETVAGPLAERLFDQSGAVRTAVVEVAGLWMIDLRDRYSWWYKLLPLLLTGANDIVPEIRAKALSLWMKAGEQFIKENETDQKFKHKLDFLLEDLPHYPAKIIRPNLGCRTIAQQNLHKLVPAISRELNDWMADIKVRAAQLLCILVLNVEEEVTEYLPKLLSPMYRACNDEDKRVVENIELAAEYMGFFVLPKVYCDLILPTLEENPTSGHLKIFASILRGSERENLTKELSRIGHLLQENHICQSRKIRYQMEILSCCRSTLDVCKEDCSIIFHDLFIAIFTTLAMSSDSLVEKSAISLLELLKKTENFENLNELFDKHVPLILTTMQESPESWEINSSEFHIFYACIVYAKSTTYKHLHLIHPVFEKTTNAEDDKKLRLKQYILLSDYLQNWDKLLEENSANAFIEFANIVLEKMIIPGLKWAAGRTAEAIRTASVCCLCALLSKIVDNCEESDKEKEVKTFSISVEHFGWLFETVRPILVTLLEDDANKTRLYSLQAICLVINIGQELSYITEEHIHKISPEIVSRLEDQHDEVRLAAVEALKEIWKVLPKDYDLAFYYVHIEYVYSKTLIHLDDPGEQFQKLTLDCLMALVKVHPELLIEKVENSRANFINQRALDQLVEGAREHLKKKNSKTN